MFLPNRLPVLLFLQQLDLITVRVSDKGHFVAGRELRAPAIRPDDDAFLLQLVALRDQVRVADGGVHQIFRHLELVVGRVTELEKVLVAGEFEERELIAGGRLVSAARALEAELFVERDGAFEVADADAGVEEFWHARRLGVWPVQFKREPILTLELPGNRERRDVALEFGELFFAE